ncbi:unnamed protein product [Calypogeia fissa]
MAAPVVEDSKSSVEDSTNGTQDQGHAHAGAPGKQNFGSHLRPLLVKKSRSVNWDKSAAEGPSTHKLPTTPHPHQFNPLIEAKSPSEEIIASKTEHVDDPVLAGSKAEEETATVAL